MKSIRLIEESLSDRYRIIRELGEGASSRVYLAEHLKLKTYRAIKCISKSHPLQSQFRLEADLLMNLSHPSIPVLYDFWEDADNLYLIEEYVEGESLGQYMLYHDHISQEYIMQLGIRLCGVLEYLHSRQPYPVYYMDLKPEHIFLCGDLVKIIDFGIASYQTGREEKFQHYGTIGYAAPEQYTDLPPTPATDLYALGKVLEQLLKKSDGSRHLKQIVRKTLEPDSGRRYLGAAALKKDLVKELERTCQKQSGKKNRHLLEQIAVVGAEPGIGTTHIAVSLNIYLNQQKQPCIYQNVTEEDIVSFLAESHFLFKGADGVCHREWFRGIPYDGAKEKQKGVSEDVYVQVTDYGSRLEECVLAQAEYTILVIGGSPWEEEAAKRACQKLQYMEHLIILCNHGHRNICKRYAAMFGRRVYSFPYDPDAFACSRRKRELFAKILQKEGRR